MFLVKQGTMLSLHFSKVWFNNFLFVFVRYTSLKRKRWEQESFCFFILRICFKKMFTGVMDKKKKCYFFISKHLRNLLRARLLPGMTHARSRLPATCNAPSLSWWRMWGGKSWPEEGCFWWGHGEGMPASAEVGAWATARKRSEKHRSQTKCPALRHLWGSQQGASSFHPHAGSSCKEKNNGLFCLLAGRGLNLELTLKIWPQLRPSHNSKHSDSTKLPNTLIICFLKFQWSKNNFQRLLRQTSRPYPRHAESES